MSTIFTLLFIVSAVGIWFFAKKRPNKKNRNIAIALTVVSFLLVGLTGTSDKKDKKEVVEKTIETTNESTEEKEATKDLSLNLDVSEIESDTNGEVIIKGTTEPGARVTVGLGVVGDSVESDAEGSFSLKYKLSGDKDKDLTINSTLDKQTASAKVKIKQNPEIVKQNAIEKEVNDVKASVDKSKENNDPKVSREFSNAKSKAVDYLNMSPFSKEGLYEQLVFEQFPDDAARYAVDNIEVDWNSQAFAKAQDYLDMSSFSDSGLYDQLIFEKYTPEQAQYAIDNLN